MLDDTQQRGLLTELHCIQDITNIGYQCLKPLNDSSKYDIVVDVNSVFYRIQCKTAKLVSHTSEENVAFEIATCCMTTNTQKTTRHKYSANEIDYFYTWFNGQGYLVSINEATGVSFRWRYEYPKSNQKQGIHIASNYKIEEVLKNLAI